MGIIVRFGVCTNLIASKPDKTGMEYIEKLADFGYDYVELPLDAVTDLSDAEFAALKERLTTVGIRSEVCCNFFPGWIRLTGPDADEEAAVAFAAKALRRAHELGTEVVGFGSANAKRVPEGFPYRAALSQLVSVTRKIAPIAAEYGIVIAIEPIRRPRSNIITTFAEGASHAEEIHQPNVKVEIDFFHMVSENESPSVLIDNKKWLAHVHIAKPILAEGKRVFPADPAEYEYAGFIETLRAVGYNERVSVEAPVSDFDAEAPQSLAVLRSIFRAF